MLIHKLNFEWFSYVPEYLCSTVSSLVWFDYWSPSYGWKGPMNQSLSILSFGSFLGIGSRGPCSAVHVSRIFEEIFFCPKDGKNGPKIGFFELIGKFVITVLWIWSIKKVHVTCCILAQIPDLGKIFFLRYWAKCSWPIRLQDF